MRIENLCQLCNHWHNRCKKYESPGIDCSVGIGAGKYVLIDEDSDLSFYILWHPNLRTNRLIMRVIEYESNENVNEFSLEHDLS